MKKLFAAVLGIIFVLSSSIVSAHVRLEPSTAVVGRQGYAVRVPNEKDIPTTAVRLVVPDNVSITGLMPVSGWKYATKTAHVEASGEAAAGHGDESAERITEITWSGGQIKPGEYMLFPFSTNYEGDPGEIVWKAYQTYSDGSVVNWDNSSEAAPAPVVTITAEAPLTTVENSVAALQNEPEAGFQPDANTWLAGLSLVISIVAVGLVLRRQVPKQ